MFSGVYLDALAADVDEHVAGHEPEAVGATNRWYVLEDDGGDVAALVDCAPPLPPPSGGGLSGVAQVAAQWTYDAYGSALTAESLAPHPVIHCGHKGLFLDRLDAGVAAGTAEIPRLVPYAHLVVQVRNRAYSPALGRFYQQDPNATAMALIGASAYHGRGVGALVTAFGLEELYGDGANLYAYLGSNPWQRHDALGLSWDPFSMVDEYVAERAGSTAAFMEELSVGFQSAVYIGWQIAQLNPAIGTMAVMYNLVTTGSVSAIDLLTLIPGGRAAGLVGKSFRSYWQGSRALRNARKAGHFVDEALGAAPCGPEVHGRMGKGAGGRADPCAA
jgi:hypothetical protein